MCRGEGPVWLVHCAALPRWESDVGGSLRINPGGVGIMSDDLQDPGSGLNCGVRCRRHFIFAITSPGSVVVRVRPTSWHPRSVSG